MVIVAGIDWITTLLIVDVTFLRKTEIMIIKTTKGLRLTSEEKGTFLEKTIWIMVQKKDREMVSNKRQ